VLGANIFSSFIKRGDETSPVRLLYGLTYRLKIAQNPTASAAYNIKGGDGNAADAPRGVDPANPKTTSKEENQYA
jgi:hypothetical protein